MFLYCHDGSGQQFGEKGNEKGYINWITFRRNFSAEDINLISYGRKSENEMPNGR